MHNLTDHTGASFSHYVDMGRITDVSGDGTFFIWNTYSGKSQHIPLQFLQCASTVLRRAQMLKRDLHLYETVKVRWGHVEALDILAAAGQPVPENHGSIEMTRDDLRSLITVVRAM